MKRSSKRSALMLIAATLLAVIGTSVCSQGQTQSQAVRAASSRADETLEMWNLIGNKLIAITQPFA
jgi:ABC-type glycerol-3-phosphate transport system substrate-binding protein